MASKVVVTKEKLNNIGDAIRNQLGVTTKYTLDEMPTKIESISGGGGSGAIITVTTETQALFGENVTLTDGVDTMTTKFSNVGVAIFNGVKMEGELTVSVTVEGETIETKIHIQSRYDTNINMIPKVYGVAWDGGRDGTVIRTDDSEDFSDPVAALNGGTGSSPFDNIYPWSEMNIVEDPECGTMVKIPKFYYKITKDSLGVLRIKISKDKAQGFSTCPACMDRGDGRGERPYILVGRYYCSNLTFKSETGKAYAENKDIDSTRNIIHALGSNVWKIDFATFMTIWMLYIVEYAHFNASDTIGRGSGSGRIAGTTDSMQYHTGTMGEARDAKLPVQYRNIEMIWGDKQYEFDGIRFDEDDVYIISNPNEFADTTAGIKVGTKAGSIYAWVTSLAVPSEDGYSWALFPDKMNGGINGGYVSMFLYNRPGWDYPKGTKLQQSGGDSTSFFNWASCSKIDNSSGTFGYRLIKLP